LPPDPHEEFEELCALSTTGELTAEESARLERHLTHCDACRESQRLFERVVAMAIPLIAEEDGAEQRDGSSPDSWSIKEAEAALMESLRNEPLPSDRKPITRATPSQWGRVRRYAIAAAILAACSVASYRAGIHQGHGTNSVVATPAPSVKSIPAPIDHTVNAAAPLDAGRFSKDGEAATLREQVRTGQLEIASLKDAQSQMAVELAKSGSDLDRSLQERTGLEQRLALAQSNAQSLQARLDLMNGQKPQDTAESLALKAQISDLNAALKDKDKEIAQEQDLLQHDRDIRNLIGARNLYIAEIYDIAKTGDTQKPFGRVFYTKDKSLIFYGYDLDQQRGVKRASTFQAWGRRESAPKADVSLGLLYQDDASQKRWALKFNDVKTIAQIDAVFITVEPEGGSAKPSGKPLLFAYLRIDPNHP
jgi:anti-sigma factor RsiW